ncbi:MAG: hypothetical protein ACFHWX_07845 [Bacteroidota bacterium]
MKINDLFKKGYNHGYILAKENPKYLNELLGAIKNKESSQYTVGLQAAKNQFLGKSQEQDQKRSKGRSI